MITLSTGTKLQVLLGGAVSATECPFTGAYVENPGDLERALYLPFSGITNSGTAVDALVGISEKRRIINFSLYNADNATVAVTVRFFDTTGTTRIIYSASLLTTQSLHYSEARGWYAIDANGAQKTTAATEASTADSKAESAATRASATLSAATSLDTANDTTASTTLSTATSVGLAASTALSTATSAGLAASVVQSNDTRQSTDQSTMRSLLASGSQAGF